MSHLWTLRFERTQSPQMASASWSERLRPLRPWWEDLLAGAFIVAILWFWWVGV